MGHIQGYEEWAEVIAVLQLRYEAVYMFNTKPMINKTKPAFVPTHL
jgi:hypothetical protein